MGWSPSNILDETHDDGVPWVRASRILGGRTSAVLRDVARAICYDRFNVETTTPHRRSIESQSRSSIDRDAATTVLATHQREILLSGNLRASFMHFSSIFLSACLCTRVACAAVGTLTTKLAISLRSFSYPWSLHLQFRFPGIPTTSQRGFHRTFTTNDFLTLTSINSMRLEFYVYVPRSCVFS